MDSRKDGHSGIAFFDFGDRPVGFITIGLKGEGQVKVFGIFAFLDGKDIGGERIEIFLEILLQDCADAVNVE